MGFVEAEVLNVDFLDAMRSLRCFNLPLKNTELDLRFRERSTVCFRAMQVFLTHCVVRERLATSPSRENISRILSLFRSLCHVVSRVSAARLCALHGG